MEYKEPLQSRFTDESCKRNGEYKLDLVALQVRWDRGGTEPAGNYTFFYGNGNENQESGSFVHRRNISAVKKGRVC
jgi:hypothetical protein